MNNYDAYYGREFNDDDKHQVTIDEFINFLIDMIDEGVDRDAKLYVDGSNQFFFHYCKDKKKINLDTKPLIEKYLDHVEGIDIKKYNHE